MSNNYWGTQQEERAYPPGNNGAPMSNGLLRRHTPQPPIPQQYMPPTGPAPQGPPVNMPPMTQMSPMPPAQPPYQGPAAGPPPSFFAHAMQTVRRWSGKVAAARPASHFVDPNPMVLYRPPAPARPEPVRRKPWRRSHAVRVSMHMRRRRARWQKSHPGKKRVLSITMSVIALLIIILTSSGVGSAYAYYQSQLPGLQSIASQQIDQSSRLYDRNGKLLFVAYDGKYGRGTPVSYNYIPGYVQDAIIAAEDETFWNNAGIDPQGILRAASINASSGSIQGGGSTITQQLIKNLRQNSQDTIQRKLSEAALAIALTQQYPKWKILEMYLNAAPFGTQELGIEAAAEDFFGLHPMCDASFKCTPALAYLDRDLTSCKNAADLSTCKADPLLGLARASILVSVPNNPPIYDPSVSTDNRVNVLLRQAYVLGRMQALGMNINMGLGDQTNNSSLGPITPSIIQQVENISQKIKFVGFHYVKNAPHFVDWVIPQLETALGNGDAAAGTHLFLTGGFNIRTSIDLDLETYVEKAVYRHLDQPEFQWFLTTNIYGPLNKYHNVNDAAVVVMNAHDGEILAMNGSANYNDNSKQVAGQYNAAIANRQPGSSFKPIVYATAFQMGWYPGIVLPDKKTYFPTSYGAQSGNPETTSYHPPDYGGVNHYNNVNSNLDMAISNSFNVPAVKTLEYAGIDNVVAMAQRLGITTITNKNGVVSMALGSLAVPLLQMVGAYQSFANQGVRVPPQGVLDIWDNYGHHLYHLDPNHPAGVQVMSKQIAYLITSILSDEKARAFEFENDHVLSMWDWPQPGGGYPQVAAKTGTTDSFVDNWTIGYTSNVVVGVWAGNADNSPMDNHVVGITGAAPIWHDVIERVSGRCNADGIPCGTIKTILPPLPFTVPPHIIQQQVNTVNGLAGTGYLSLMIDTTIPVQTGLTKNGTGTGPTATPTP